MTRQILTDRARGGFTLIELFAVVVLIGLIAAITIPNFMTVRERAYSATLRSDLRRVQSELEVFYSQHQRYTSNLDSLNLEGMGGVSLFLRADSTEWEAVALREGQPLRFCSVSSRRREILCDELAVPRPVSRLDSLVARLPWAATVLQAPTRMRVGETRTVTLVLDPSYTPSADIDTVALPLEVQDSLRATLAGVQDSDSVRFRPVRRAERMVARLAGGGFEIDPPPSDDGRLVQGVIASRPTEWTWQVTASAGGRRSLEMTLWALLDVAGETPVRFQVLRHEVEVRVNWGDRLAAFARRYWVWLIMLVLAPPPLILWIVKKMKSRKVPPDRPWQTPL